MKIKYLTIGYTSGMSQDELKDHLHRFYDVDKSKLENLEILIALEKSDDYYSESAWWLVRDNKGELYETYASHCSCYGFEGQFEPEHTCLEYLSSANFGVNLASKEELEEIFEFIRGLDE